MKMNSLSNLLAHEIVDLYSAEGQIIDALPQMIGKAQNQELKKALQEHLKVTEQQKKRLEKVHKMLQEEDGSSDEKLGDTTCLGMKGLIEEGKKALKEDMEPEVMDAAIIACADSRVSPDIVFDQPLGSIFASRVPGNVASDSAKYAPMTPAIAPFAPTTGARNPGAATTTVRPATAPAAAPMMAWRCARAVRSSRV